jgi:hypothetical protein
VSEGGAFPERRSSAIRKQYGESEYFNERGNDNAESVDHGDAKDGRANCPRTIQAIMATL